MTLEEILAARPGTLGAEDVATLWDISERTVYQSAREGTCPIPPLKIGRSLRWPAVPVLRQLGIELFETSENGEAQGISRISPQADAHPSITSPVKDSHHVTSLDDQKPPSPAA